MVAVWTDSRNAATKPDLYAQRIDSTGAAQWTAGGVPISLAAGTQGTPSIASSGNGGGIIAWPDDRGADWDIYAQNVNGDGSLGGTIVDVLVALVTASAGPDGVTLQWQLGASIPPRVTLERTESADLWRTLGGLLGSGAGLVSYTDNSVLPGHRYGYRLRFMSGSQAVTSSPTWVEVPARSSLSLAGAWPNPTSGDAMVAFSLGSSAPARLELFDVRGRCVLRRDVTGAAGNYRMRLAGPGQLPAGLYWLTLRQGESTLSRRLVVTK